MFSKKGSGQTRRRRLSYANVAATLALLLALGGGTAWASKHVHFVITSTSQIKPSVRAALRGAKGTDGINGTNGTNGANGTNGTNGAVGATGPMGVAGNVGPQGPGALMLDATIAANTATSAVGAIPVDLSFNQEAGTAQAAIDSTAVASGTFPIDTSGTFSATFENGATGTSSAPFIVYGAFGTSSGTNLNGGGLTNDTFEQVGTIVLTYTSEDFPHYTDTTETVNYEVSVGTGTGTNGTCTIGAQIVSSTTSGTAIL